MNVLWYLIGKGANTLPKFVRFVCRESNYNDMDAVFLIEAQRSALIELKENISRLKGMGVNTTALERDFEILQHLWIDRLVSALSLHTYGEHCNYNRLGTKKACWSCPRIRDYIRDVRLGVYDTRRTEDKNS